MPSASSTIWQAAFSSRVHTISVSVSERPSPHPMSSASAFSASASSFGSAVHGKQPVFILRHGPHDRLIQLDRAAPATHPAELPASQRRFPCGPRPVPKNMPHLYILPSRTRTECGRSRFYLSPDCANAVRRPQSPGLSQSISFPFKSKPLPRSPARALRRLRGRPPAQVFRLRNRQCPADSSHPR